MIRCKPTLYIDGDLLLYKFGFRHQNVYDFGPDIEDEVTTTDFNAAKADLKEFIHYLIRTTKAKEGIVCLSGDDNFRYKVLPTYKHNRKDLVKPLLYTKLKEHILGDYKVRTQPVLEADDLMGIYGTSKRNNIIATIDKDLKQVPCKRFDWNHPDEGVVNTPKVEAERFFYQQILTGDSTDGYSGCPGIGPVKAQKLLDGGINPLEWWETIVEAYAVKGLTEEDALQQARVARILRQGDYDFRSKAVYVWTPDRDHF